MPSHDDNSLLTRTGPGTLAGRYLRRFWQPVYRSEDLAPGRAVPIRIISEGFTLYRGESGAPYLVAFRCAHRGTQLSAGWVEDEDIRCRYHGWKYDGSGQCVEQPGEDEPFAARVRIQSYPAREYLGLVFAYLGEGEPPPFRRHPDFEKPGLLINIAPELWPCNYFNRLDNDADAYHVLFTHREAIQRANKRQDYVTRQVSAEETQYGVRTTIMVPGRHPEYLHSHMPQSNQIRVKTGLAGPWSQTALWEDRITWAVPVDDESSLRFEANHVSLAGEAAEAYREEYRRLQAASTPPNELGEAILAGKLRISDLDRRLSTYEIFRIEDYVCQVGQGRIAGRSQEQLGRTDMGVLLRRKLWQRELAALAEDRPLKQWTIPEGLANMSDA